MCSTHQAEWNQTIWGLLVVVELKIIICEFEWIWAMDTGFSWGVSENLWLCTKIYSTLYTIGYYTRTLLIMQAWLLEDSYCFGQAKLIHSLSSPPPHVFLGTEQNFYNALFLT